MQYAEIELSEKAMQRMWCRRSVEFIWVERAHESRTFQARHVPNCMYCGTSANPSKHSRWRSHRVSVVCTYHRSVEKMADNRVFCLFLSDRQAQALSTDIKWMHSESARVSWRSCSVECPFQEATTIRNTFASSAFGVVCRLRSGCLEVWRPRLTGGWWAVVDSDCWWTTFD